MADFSDLKREWDAQPEMTEAKMNEIADLVRTRSKTMRSTLFARDMREAAACVIIILVFGAYWVLAPNLIAKTGCAIAVAGSVEIMVLMWFVRGRSRVDFTSVPLKEFLLSEVRHLNRQIALLRLVAWWYLLPLYSGACLFVIGIGSVDDWESGPTFAVAFCLGYFVLCAFVWRLNQTARRKSLEPLRDAMQRTYEGLSALDSESTESQGELLGALADPELDCQSKPPVRIVKPQWHQVVVMIFAGLGGAYVGMLIQQWTGEPMRYEEWPLVGLLVAGGIALGSTCVRRVRKGA